MIVGIEKIGNFLSRIRDRISDGLINVWRRMRQGSSHKSAGIILFILILLIGIYARTWQFKALPPGLHQDEASIGLEAYDLLHYGVDRNGISFPVNFVSWGNGMDALYGYVLIPFMLFGLSAVTIRLPSLIFGILTLPLVYLIGVRTLGKRYGLLAMFLLAISPWHILMSRWGINENILPFVFTLGLTCLLLSSARNQWFIGAAIAFGLCIYAYGASYVAVPVMLVCAIPVLLFSKRVRVSSVLIGMLVFLILVVPAGLFVLVNALGWNSIHIGILTIPRLPVLPRFMSVASFTKASPGLTLLENAVALGKFLFFKTSDGAVWNVVDPYGYLYSFSFPLAVVGIVLLFPFRGSGKSPEKLLILASLLAGLSVGLSQVPTTNRICLVYIPLVFCAAAFLDWLGSRRSIILATLVLIYLVSFSAFDISYHGSYYRQRASQAFFEGLIPAIQAAGGTGSQPVCVTDSINMPYVFVLFAEKPNPSTYLESIRYVDPKADFRQVQQMGRYSFGLANCPKDPNTVYLLSDEQPPQNGIHYTEETFVNYHVFIP